MASSPKTHKVLLKDGTEGRAVRLSARNDRTVLNWVPGAVLRKTISKAGQESNQRLMLNVRGTKTVRAAYYDDWVVKTSKGFQVVKFDKSEESLFFVDSDSWPSEQAKDTAFILWTRS